MQEDYERQLAEQEDRSNKAQQELEEHYNRSAFTMIAHNKFIGQ